MISLKKILVPIDFSSTSKKAVLYGASLAKTYCAELTIMVVVDDRIFQDGLFDASFIEQEALDTRNKAFEERLEEVRKEVLEKESPINVITKMPFGVAFAEIIHYAKEEKTDLIVMGTHGTTGIAHMLIGSTTEKVVRKAPCPVMIVRD